MLKQIDVKKLKEPFPEESVAWRVMRAGLKGNRPWARVVPYIDARAVQDRLDAVCGPEGWQTRNVPTQNGVICELSISIDGEWVTKSDGSEWTDIEGFKGGISKALVRAAVQWGVGRYLYEAEACWANFVDQNAPGAEYVKIEGGEYYWIPDLPASSQGQTQDQASIGPMPDQSQESPRDPKLRAVNPGPARRRSSVPQVISARASHSPVTPVSPSASVAAQTAQALPVPQVNSVQATPGAQKLVQMAALSTSVGDAYVPFGQTKGRPLRDLTEAELAGLQEFYSRVPSPKGKGGTFKPVFEAFLAARQAGAH